VIARASVAAQPLAAATTTMGNPWTPKAPHFPAKATHVIVVFLQGGLSQINSFDYKSMESDRTPSKYGTLRLPSIFRASCAADRASGSLPEVIQTRASPLDCAKTQEIPPLHLR